MKTISLFIALFGLSACSATNSTATENGVKSMKQYASIERMRCLKTRYRSVKSRLECKQKIRAELNAKLEKEEKNHAEN